MFPLQAQKEDFVHQLITARRVVRAQCPAQLGPIPTSLASQPAPAAQQATTVQERPTSSPSFLAPLDSTVLMVSDKYDQYLFFFPKHIENYIVVQSYRFRVMNLMHRYTARHAVSLSSWILQPGTHDSESGQLPSLSSRTLL